MRAGEPAAQVDGQHAVDRIEVAVFKRAGRPFNSSTVDQDVAAPHRGKGRGDRGGVGDVHGVGRHDRAGRAHRLGAVAQPVAGNVDQLERGTPLGHQAGGGEAKTR